jgi:methyl-accepting chemotaxis protein
LQHISITQKMMLIIGIVGLFILGGAYYFCGQMKHIDHGYSALMANQERALLYSARANRTFVAARASIADIAISNTATEDSTADAAFAQSLSDFKNEIDVAIRASSDQAPRLQALKALALNAITNACARAIAMGDAADTTPTVLAAQQEYLTHCAPAFPPVITGLTTAVVDMIAAADRADDRLTEDTDRTIVITYSGIIGGLILIGLIAVGGIRRWIIMPLQQQLATMARLASGDYSAQVAGAERRDELGAIARAVAIFRDNGQEKRRLEAETAAQTARADEERVAQEAHRAAAARKSAFVVGELAKGLEKLSAGDLLFRLGTPFDTDYESLRMDFNAAMEKMQETMKAIALTTEGVRSGSGEITQASDDLSRRTEQQAASLEETAAALDQITATVRRTAENAQEARETVSSAKSDAEHSGVVVSDAVTAMSAIETSARQISKIIGVIDEIAFQTNLLALNAGVEAARAGEAGRGFAVVATEVRALAQRSADAAKEIKTLISASGQQVESGVRLVSETGKALARIVTQVERLNRLVSDIAASAQEQSTGLNEVNTAVNQMDQVTQQNAAMVEQSTAASHNLASTADGLAELVAQFRIGAVAGHRQQAPSAPQRALAGRRTGAALVDAGA